MFMINGYLSLHRIGDLMFEYSIYLLLVIFMCMMNFYA